MLILWIINTLPWINVVAALLIFQNCVLRWMKNFSFFGVNLRVLGLWRKLHLKLRPVGRYWDARNHKNLSCILLLRCISCTDPT
ncbi:hypothetical protein P3L10_002130 [Capsicum annuum]